MALEILNWKTFGHSEILRYIKKSVEQDRLSHAYLFTGPDRVGKTTVAIDLACLINAEHKTTKSGNVVVDLKNGNGPDLFRFSFGYAGWEKGQIEREIENGDWLLMPADDKF
ncbi:MAG: YqgE/AlgH family protein, partial [Dehalococcoidia bacterium]|nr:YqgE/AlgH family protein [Dehalococcoidia bacterium]